MILTKYKLGDLIEPFNKQCNIPNLTIWDISGINSDKEFFEPSKQIGKDTSKYKIVPQNYFACNLMHVGRDMVLPIALNYTSNTKIVSPAYTVFKIKNNIPLLINYFYIMLKSSECDRYFWFHTDSSIRDGMSWEDFCDLEIKLPPLSIQQKYVNIYNAMIANQQCYEHKLNDLKFICEAYIDKLKKDVPLKKLKNYISLCNATNDDLIYGINDVRGISIEKRFIPTKANMDGVSLKYYTVVNPNEFAFVPVTSRNGEKISIACNNNNKSYICSSTYIVFKINDITKLLPKYLLMWFERNEFDRYARFNSWGSAREIFNWEEMCNVKIPIIDSCVQQDIVNIFETYNSRKNINTLLKKQIKNICPILIKGAIDEAKRLKEV